MTNRQMNPSAGGQTQRSHPFCARLTPMFAPLGRLAPRVAFVYIIHPKEYPESAFFAIWARIDA